MTILRAELAVTAAVIGTMAGAGFASGQELVQFFLCLGPRAPAALALMAVLLSLAAGLARYLAGQWRTQCYRDFLVVLLGSWAKPADLATAAFLFGGVAIMLAGSGAVARQYFGLPPLAGSLACVAVASLAGLGRGRGLLLLNAILVPVMLLIMVVAAGTIIFHRAGPLPAVPPLPAGGLVSNSWFLNAGLYVAYNMLGLAVLLTSLPGRQGVAGAGLGGLLLGGVVYLLVTAMAGLSPAALRSELPLLHLVAGIHAGMPRLFALALWLAMVTTAASDLFGLVSRLNQIPGLTPVRAVTGVWVLAVPVAGCGFITLVSWIYPFFGYLGLVFLVLALVRYQFKI